MAVSKGCRAEPPAFAAGATKQAALNEIIAAQRMPVFTVTALLRLPAMLLKRVYQVVARRSQKQMRRINTRRIVAAMAHLSAFSDRTVDEFIREAMRVSVFTISEQFSVSERAASACPYPALACLIDTRPEAILGWRIGAPDDQSALRVRMATARVTHPVILPHGYCDGAY